MLIWFNLALSSIDLRSKEILTSTLSDIELIDSARDGTNDYDFESKKLLRKGGQAMVYELKSKIDGKTYAGKCLQYQIDYETTLDIKAAA